MDDLVNMFQNDLIVFDLMTLTPEERRRPNTSTSRFIHSVLKEYEIEYLLCFGEKILKKELLTAYAERLINFHPSILPLFKGLRAIDQALNEKAVFLGNTAHLMDQDIDSGKIILQSAMLSNEFEDYGDVLELQYPMIKMVLRDLLNYDVNESDVFLELSGRKKKMLMPDCCNHP